MSFKLPLAAIVRFFPDIFLLDNKGKVMSTPASRSDGPFASNQASYSTKGDQDQSLDNKTVALTSDTVYIFMAGLNSTIQNWCTNKGAHEWFVSVPPSTVKWHITPPLLALTK